MTGMVPAFRRALAMPLPVLARKLTQRGRALAHRLVTTPGSAWQYDGVPLQVLQSIRANGPLRFFASATERPALIEVLKAREPGAEAAILCAADEVCAHRFDLLGSGPTDLGERIDWHRDFRSGHRWELRHHSSIDYLDLGRTSDVKVVWELSRCHHWVRLGQAYWLTGKSRYVEEFLAQWESWIRENPPGFGVNWTCAMEVAIRAVNWLWAFFLFADAPAFDVERQRRFLAALAAHGRFVLHNLEVGPLPGNHYLTDGVGLLALGAVLPELKGARRWFHNGWRIVWGELGRQVTSDGVNYEHAIGYHGYVLQCMLFVLSLCRRNGLEVPGPALERIERMLEFTLAYVRPDRSIPLIGDSDDGSLVELGERLAEDHRPLLAAGCALFGRADLKAATERFGTANLWLLGIEGLEAYDAVQEKAEPQVSRAFPHGGFFVLRSRDRHLIVSGAGSGPASHLHHDLLSFECWAGGTTYVLDPGTYVYTASPEWRNRFRSTAFHNVVMVDGQEQTRLLTDPNLFPIARDATAVFTLHGWEAGEEFDSLDAEHAGYTRLPQPVTHRRKIWFHRTEGFWVVQDLLSGIGEHRITGFLHLAALEVAIESQDPWMVSVGDEEGEMVIAWVPTPALTLSVTEGWVSPRYGVKRKAPVICYETSGRLPIRISFVMVPGKRGAPRTVPGALCWAMERL